MEIDFLGLNSSKYGLDHENPKNPYVDSGGGLEVSLSLSTSSSLNLSEKKKCEVRSGEKMISPNRLAPYNKEKTRQPSLFLRHTAAGGFLYDLNDASTLNLRNINMAKHSSLTMLYTNFTQPEKAENASTAGYTPTVAMARRATLARFLEKRLHRMNQGRAASHLMGRSSKTATNLEVVETTITKNNNKKNNLKRR